MWIVSRKELEDVTALVHAMTPSGRAGIELALVASRAQITPERAEKLLQKHADYFVRVGDEQKFTLNRFGELDGSAERIIADAQANYKRHSNGRIAILVVLAILLMVSTK